MLTSQFNGQIVIEDFGFYARPFHTRLIREDRLMAGVYTLSELDEKLRQMCLLMETEAAECTFEDAEVLARYEGMCRVQMRSIRLRRRRWWPSWFRENRAT